MPWTKPKGSTAAAAASRRRMSAVALPATASDAPERRRAPKMPRGRIQTVHSLAGIRHRAPSMRIQSSAIPSFGSSLSRPRFRGPSGSGASTSWMRWRPRGCSNEANGRAVHGDGDARRLIEIARGPHGETRHRGVHRERDVELRVLTGSSARWWAASPRCPRSPNHNGRWMARCPRGWADEAVRRDRGARQTRQDRARAMKSTRASLPAEPRAFGSVS